MASGNGRGHLVAQVPAGDRLKLMLSVVPWIVANPGHTMDQIADRFGMKTEDLDAELEVLWMVGLPPYTPDTLIEIVEDPESHGLTIRFAEYFRRPLRLSHGEALTLLAASEGLRSLPGGEAEGPLDRALAKVGATLSPEAASAIDVDLGSAEAEVLGALREASERGLEVRIRYYSASSDSTGERKIAPWRVFAQDGSWYVVAWCSQAEGERIFRLDRIEGLETLTTISPNRPDDSALIPEGETALFHPRPNDPTVTLRLNPDSRWVVETYPTQNHEINPDGTIDATLVITAIPWLERLLVQLGAQVRLLDSRGLNNVADIRANTARRILARYSL